MFQRPLVIGSAVAYAVLVLAIGVWAARRTRNARDFFIAGQRLGLLVTAMATMSAAFSGFVFIGGPGLAYTLGIGSLWIVVPLGFTAGMLCQVAGRPLRRLAGVREVFTIPDAVAARYASRHAAACAAVAVSFGSIAYLAAQIRALGILAQTTLGFEAFGPAMLAAVLVVVAYATMGGMVAGVYTDLVQGALMLVAACAVFVHAGRIGGGWERTTRSIAGSEAFGPGFLEPLGRVAPMTAFGFVFVFGLGVLGQPHLLHKFFMVRDARALRWLPWVLGSSQALCLLVWIGIGLAVPGRVASAAMAPLVRPDEAAPRFLVELAPAALAGVVVAAVLAAIMSSADSFVNIASAALVRDLPRAVGRTVQRELLWGRVGVVGIGLASTALAWLYDDLIALVGTFAFGTFAAALAPSLSLGLVWTKVPGSAAAASIVTGLVANLGLELLSEQTWFASWPRPPLVEGALPSAVALALSFVVLVGVTLWRPDGSPAGLPSDVREALRG